MIEEALEELHARLAPYDGERFLCLATTANVNNPPVLVGSLRQGDGVLAGNIIFRDTASLPEIVNRFDGLVTRYFVDCEVKAGVDLGAIVRPLVDFDRMHFFKPNDFTVEAADEWIAQRIPKLAGARIAIVGAGNIGAKLALRLAERGGRVGLVARRVELLQATVRGLCAILRGGGSVGACADIAEACEGAAVIVGCTPGTSVIDAAAIEVSNAELLLDVGNGCFTTDAIAAARKRGLLLEVLSPTAGWEGFLRRYAATRRLQRGLGRRQLESGVWIVSRGVMGEMGDVLVDDVSRPARVIGICNGMGDLLYGEEVGQRIKIVEAELGIV